MGEIMKTNDWAISMDSWAGFKGAVVHKNKCLSVYKNIFLLKYKRTS